MGDSVFLICLLGVSAIVILNIFWKRRVRRIAKQEEEEAIRNRLEELRMRREELVARFGSEEIADAVIASKVWQGMSKDQLLESWGTPEDIDTKVYKMKTSETWKYGEIGKNRYSSKVFLENDFVVGWDQR